MDQERSQHSFLSPQEGRSSTHLPTAAFEEAERYRPGVPLRQYQDQDQAQSHALLS